MNVEDVVWYIVMNTNIDTQDVLREDNLEKSTEDIMREIIDARDNAVERAGIVTISDIGDTSSNSYYYADGAYTGANPGVAFVVGNGDIDSTTGDAGANPSNAFVVNYDGSATLGGDLTVNSDARLKSNIISLGSTLSKLLLIDGKSYTMKTNESIAKIGLLAQEVQQAFPELVKAAGDEEGTLSVNYQGMIPVLINAIKEQQKQIDELKALINQ